MKHLHSIGIWALLVLVAVCLFPFTGGAESLGADGTIPFIGIGLLTEYGDITPRLAAYSQKELLKRGLPYLNFELFGQGKPVPTRMTKVTKFRRYEALDATPNALTEGVTPSSKTLTHTDITATLVQYGDLVTITDVIADTHEDDVLNEALDLLAEQAAIMIETVRFGILKAGTNIQYSGSATARDEVTATIDLAMQRRVTRTLDRQNARPITKRVSASPNYATEPVAPAFIALCHPDLDGDIRNITGFTATEKYAGVTPYDNEVGKVERVRYLTSTILVPFADAGGANANMLATTNAAVAIDVYPILYIAQNSYGIVPLKGKASITPSVIQPVPSKSDPLGQRGHASWKAMTTACILNDNWMVRGECGATA